MLITVIGWCLFGLIVGALSRFLLPGRDPMGWIATMLVGIAGSFTAGAIFHVLFGSSGEAMQPAGFIGAVIGSVLLLIVIRSICRRRSAGA